MIPDSVINMDGFVFYSCAALTNVIFGRGVTSIPASTFYACGNLSNIVIPDSIKSIGDSAFYSCSSLTRVTIPNGVTNIGNYTFQFCTGLISITIPNRVTNLGYYVFWGCNNLISIWFQGNAPSVDSTTFGNGVIATVYYLPGTTNWGSTLGVLTSALWNAQPQSTSVQTNQFGFTIIGTTNIPFVVEGCTNLVNATWTALQTYTLTNGSIYFSDPNWTNYPGRLYRIRSP